MSNVGRGERQRLHRRFTRQLLADFRKRGSKVFEDLYAASVVDYVNTILKLAPKDHNVTYDADDSLVRLLDHIENGRLPSVDRSREPIGPRPIRRRPIHSAPTGRLQKVRRFQGG